jgi:hypothetical protein
MTLVRAAALEAATTLPETVSLPSVIYFAECQISGTRQRGYLPSAALGKVRHSAKIALPSAGHSVNKVFAESPAPCKDLHSAKTTLQTVSPNGDPVRHSTKFFF